MNDRFASRPLLLSIAAVERDTGLSKDTLRVWERRYGFPRPERDTLGERVYPMEQVEKLRVVKRLLDAGHRAGRIVDQPIEDLQRLCESTLDQAPSPAPASAASPDLRDHIDDLRAHDVVGLRRRLGQALARLGLARFVEDVVVPLNVLVGDAWMRGQMQVFEEHVYTEVMQGVLRHALASMPEPQATVRPCVLLTTFPGEPHGLGLLMAEVMLAVDGCRCVSLGVQTPVWDVVLAAQAYQADVVAIGFTASLNPKRVIDSLVELRTKLAPATAVWAGGAAPVLQRRPVPGVDALSTLGDLSRALRRWRAGAG